VFFFFTIQCYLSQPSLTPPFFNPVEFILRCTSPLDLPYDIHLFLLLFMNKIHRSSGHVVIPICVCVSVSSCIFTTLSWSCSLVVMARALWHLPQNAKVAVESSISCHTLTISFNSDEDTSTYPSTLPKRRRLIVDTCESYLISNNRFVMI